MEDGPVTRSRAKQNKDQGRKLRPREAKGPRINFADLELSESDDEIKRSQKEEDKEMEVATQLGLPPDTLSWREKQELPAIAADDADHYVMVRNAILMKWNKNPKEYLTKAEATSDLRENYVDTASKAHDFLTRYGYINTGVFENPRTEWNKERVLIIGAGAAGLAAASQLHHLGYKVTVLEARDRIGGRVNTDTSLGCPVDMGAMIITGTQGNPFYALTQQVGAEMHEVDSPCELYDIDGKPIQKDIDTSIEDLYNKVLQRTVKLQSWEIEGGKDTIPSVYGTPFFVRPKPQRKVAVSPEIKAEPTTTEETTPSNTAPGSLSNGDLVSTPTSEKATERVQESVMLALEQFYSESDTALPGSLIAGTVALKEELTSDSSETVAVKMEQTTMEVEIKQEQRVEETVSSVQVEAKETTPAAEEKKLVVPVSQPIQPRPKRAIDKCSLGAAIDHALHEIRVMLTPLEQRIFDWHIANLEYGCASELSALSLKHWDQDDQYEFPGPHGLLRTGYTSVLSKLATGLDIRLSHVVEKITYHEQGVSAVTTTGELFEGDIMLVTIPLGVLQEGNITFEPPLPSWKTDSIDHLGFGNLNKVALLFPSVFWDNGRDFFGCLMARSDERGECFMFNNIHRVVGKPVLLALVAGASSYAQESRTDLEIVERAMKMLKKVYPNAPEPLNYKVTRWYSDPFARGSYSFIATNATGDDYDVMARPVTKRLFFAGEATQREHPATVAGAYLSGLREAGRIDRAWSGPIEIACSATTEEEGKKKEKEKRRGRLELPRFRKKKNEDNEDSDRRRKRSRSRSRSPRSRSGSPKRGRGGKRRNGSDEERDRKRRHSPPPASAPTQSTAGSPSKRPRPSETLSSSTPSARAGAHSMPSPSAGRPPGGPPPSGEYPPPSYRYPAPQQQYHQYQPIQPKILPAPAPWPQQLYQHQQPQRYNPPQMPSARNTYPSSFPQQASYPGQAQQLPHMPAPSHPQSQQQQHPYNPPPRGYSLPPAAQSYPIPGSGLMPQHSPPILNGPMYNASMPRPSSQPFPAQPSYASAFSAGINPAGSNFQSKPAPVSVSAPTTAASSNNTTTTAAANSTNDNTKSKPPEKAANRGSDGKPLSEDKAFRKEVGAYIVHYLKKYLENSMIASKEDFKHLARKLTHLVVEKEQRRALLKKNGRLTFNSKVKKKVTKFVDGYFDQLTAPYTKKSK